MVHKELNDHIPALTHSLVLFQKNTPVFYSSPRSYCLSYCSSRFRCRSPLLTPLQVREARVSHYFYFMRLMFCEIWEKFRENVSFWYIYELGVQIFMKLWYLTLFLVFWSSRSRWTNWLGRWATVYFSDMCSFSKIDFPDSLTIWLSSNFDIWFITCYFMVWPVGSSIRCL